MKSPSVFAPLREGRFSRYMAGEAISMVGSWMQFFAQGWLLTTLTSSAFALGAINFASGVPMLLLTLVGGNFADRYEKRRILYCVLAVQIIAALALGRLVELQQIKIWHILVTAICLGIASAFEVPTVSAFVPELVPKEQISSAIAIDRSVFHFTRLLGPAVAGWLIARYGTATAYYLNALSFVALIAALLSIRPRREPATAAEEESQKGGIALGLAYVKADAPTRRMIMLMATMTLFVSPFLMILMPLYSRLTLHLSPEHMGILIGISGLGAFSGSLGLLSIPRGHRTIAVKCAAAATTLGLGGLAISPTLVPACFSIVLLTLGLSSSFGLSNIVIQERAPHHLRGRVSAVASLSFFGLVPFSGMIIAGLVDWVHMRPAMIGCTACFGLAVTLLLSGVSQLAPGNDEIRATNEEIIPKPE